MNRYILLLSLIAVSASCSNDSDPAADKANFVRIYDNDKFNSSYFPIDIKQTPDGGYLILGGRRLTDSNFSGTYLLRVDQYGAFISQQEIGSDKVAPIEPLLETGGKYYFFSMTPVGLTSQLTEMGYKQNYCGGRFLSFSRLQ